MQTSDNPKARLRPLLTAAVWLTLGMHLAIVLLLRSPIVASNFMIAMAPLAASCCVLWRSTQVEPSERSAWHWIALASALWAVGQLTELHVETLADNVTPQIADFFFFIVAIPLLLAVASTPATKSVRGLRRLNAFQAVLAAGLIYVRLFRMQESDGNRVLSTVYAVELAVVTLAVLVRWIASSTPEDRRCMGMLAAFLCIYSPIEIGIDSLAQRWNLRVGTAFDLFWTLPFLALSLLVLYFPVDDRPAPRRDASEQRGKLLLQSLCPALFTCCVLALAASIASQHLMLAFGAILVSLVIQGLHAGIIQVNYLVSRDRLLKQEEELKAANAGLERLSFLDELTGIPNRRHFTEVLHSEWHRASRKREWLAILMVDVDHFKGVNDLHGHSYGDRCLVSTAHALRATLGRPSDLIARYGGEEFIVLLPETDLHGATLVAERLQHALAALHLRNDASPFDRQLTMSIGVAATQPRSDSAPGRLIDCADQALYEAKRRGRNRICLDEMIEIRETDWTI